MHRWVFDEVSERVRVYMCGMFVALLLSLLSLTRTQEIVRVPPALALVSCLSSTIRDGYSLVLRRSFLISTIACHYLCCVCPTGPRTKKMRTVRNWFQTGIIAFAAAAAKCISAALARQPETAKARADQIRRSEWRATKRRLAGSTVKSNGTVVLWNSYLNLTMIVRVGRAQVK